MPTRFAPRPPPPRDFVHELTTILSNAWSALSEGCTNSRDPFHTPTVATTRQGGPVLRTVVLRTVDKEGSVLGFNTDRRSPKCADLKAEPRLAWHFYDRDRKTQIRIVGIATLHTDDEVATVAWNEVTALGRRCYGQPLGPGVASEDADIPLPDLPALEAEDPTVVAACRANFCTVRCTVTDIDWLHLRFEGHRRARFTRDDDGWTGQWIAP